MSLTHKEYYHIHGMLTDDRIVDLIDKFEFSLIVDSEEYLELEDQVGNLEDEIDELKKEIDELKDENAGLRVDLREANHQIDALESEIEQLNVKYDINAL